MDTANPTITKGERITNPKVGIRPYHRKPTIKQLMALRYRNQGMSWREAMIKAGYSKNSALKPKEKLLNSPQVQGLLESMQGYLVDEGLTGKYMAGKMKEWISAKKTVTSPTEPDKEVPDYDVQLKAYDRWEKAINNPKTTKGKVRREMTFTEFVTGEEDK